MYGPTEATIWSTSYTVKETPTEALPLGQPISQTQLHILDPNNKLAPCRVGQEGELFIGGMGLARGYLNRPELTKERFITHMVAAQPPVRLYRTGDVVMVSCSI